MFLHRSDAQMYPQCAKLISTIASRLHGMPDVEKVFFEACEADELNGATAADARRVARAALQAGKEPFVDVHQGELKVPEGGKIVDACGFTDTFGKKPFIIITYVWFDAFEFGIDSERDKNATRLIRTVLHETVHWVRETIGADDQITVGGRFRGHMEEAGRFFESRAFATPSLCNDAEILDALTALGPSGERQRTTALKSRQGGSQGNP